MKQETFYFLHFFLLFIFIQIVTGQNATKPELYKLPSEYRLAFVAVQKTAPLQFADIDVLVEKRGGTPIINWTLKNNSSKTVRRFQVAFKIRTNVGELTGTGGQIGYDIGTDEKNDLILPHGSYTEFTNPENSLPIEIRNWFKFSDKLGSPKLVIVYGMIKKVVFNDGTVYSEDNALFEGF